MNSTRDQAAALCYTPPERAVLGLRSVHLDSRDKVFVEDTCEVVLRVE